MGSIVLNERHNPHRICLRNGVPINLAATLREDGRSGKSNLPANAFFKIVCSPIFYFLSLNQDAENVNCSSWSITHSRCDFTTLFQGCCALWLYQNVSQSREKEDRSAPSKKVIVLAVFERQVRNKESWGRGRKGTVIERELEWERGRGQRRKACQRAPTAISFHFSTNQI